MLFREDPDTDEEVPWLLDLQKGTATRAADPSLGGKLRLHKADHRRWANSFDVSDPTWRGPASDLKDRAVGFLILPCNWLDPLPSLAYLEHGAGLLFSGEEPGTQGLGLPSGRLEAYPDGEDQLSPEARAGLIDGRALALDFDQKTSNVTVAYWEAEKLRRLSCSACGTAYLAPADQFCRCGAALPDNGLKPSSGPPPGQLTLTAGASQPLAKVKTAPTRLLITRATPDKKTETLLATLLPTGELQPLGPPAAESVPWFAVTFPATGTVLGLERRGKWGLWQAGDKEVLATGSLRQVGDLTNPDISTNGSNLAVLVSQYGRVEVYVSRLPGRVECVASGSLRPTYGTVFAAGAAHFPSGRLFVPETDDGVYEFSLRKSGPPKKLGLLTEGTAGGVAISPDGKFLYLTEWDAPEDSFIHTYDVSGPKPVKVASYKFGFRPQNIQLFEEGAFVRDSRLEVLRRLGNGALKPVSSVERGTSSGEVVWDPKGRLLLVIQREGAVVFRLDRNLKATRLQDHPGIQSAHWVK